MNGEAHYHSLWKSLTRLFVDISMNSLIYGHHNPDYLWDGLERALAEVLRWADISKAARLRYRAEGQKTVLPLVDHLQASDVVDANPWLYPHVEQSSPLIEARAGWIAETERKFQEGRAGNRDRFLKDVLKGRKELYPMYRLERVNRDAVGEIAAVSEQIELSVPKIGGMFPFSEYLTREDRRVRPTHAAMHRFVAVRTWDGWPIIRPKNGYNCRCYLIHRTKRQAIKAGWMDEDGNPLFEFRWPNSAAERNFNEGQFPDPGWHGPKIWSTTGAPQTVSV